MHWFRNAIRAAGSLDATRPECRAEQGNCRKINEHSQ
jgi:hypothetical protein